MTISPAALVTVVLGYFGITGTVAIVKASLSYRTGKRRDHAKAAKGGVL